MRGVVIGFLFSAATARAETRLGLAAIPIAELEVFESAYPVDKQAPPTDHRCIVFETVGAGFGSVDADRGPTAAGTLQLGLATRYVLAVARSELAVASDFSRGRHRALVEVHGDPNDTGRQQATLDAHVDHGRAVGLAPVHLGPGSRIDTGVRAHGVMRLGPNPDNPKYYEMQLGVRAEAGTTRWSDAAIERADRRAVGLGWGFAPVSPDVPRDSDDWLRAKVEHVTIHRPLAAAGIGTTPTEVRIVEVGAGIDDLTFHVDRELLAVIAMDGGWSWLEADRTGSALGPIRDNAFRFRLAGAVRWRLDAERIRHLGLGISRLPTYTPDGQRLVTDARIELAGGVDGKRTVVAVRGGISAISPAAPNDEGRNLFRYGSQLDGFVKLRHGLEVGGYHAMWFDTQTVGDPWATPRRWTTEAGLLLRFRAPPP